MLLLITALALLVRLPHLSQSLWYDEMTTLLEYVLQPWQKVVAGHPGQYVPNNHVLYSIFAKLVYTVTSGGDPTALPVREAMLRLPALLAGALLPMAITWPLRRREPWLALLLAIFVCVNPWMVAFSEEARGYTLLMLLGIFATHVLPDGRRRWPILYALLMAAALYTLIIAAMLLAAHGAAVVFLKRGRAALLAWARGAAVAVGVALLLYLPMMHAMAQYYRNPFPEVNNYATFLDRLPRFAAAGERLPRRNDPIVVFPDSASGALYWAVPVLVVILGTAAGLSRPAVRPLLISMASVTVLAVAAPLIMKATWHERFVPWAGIWLCVALAVIFSSAPTRSLCIAATTGAALVIAWMGWRDAVNLPNEPIREAITLADRLAPPGADLMTGYLGAREAAALYPREAGNRVLLASPDLPTLCSNEEAALMATGRRPWVIMSFESLAFRRDNDAESRGFWSHLMKNYRRVATLEGRISPVSIYAPKEPLDSIAANQ